MPRPRFTNSTKPKLFFSHTRSLGDIGYALGILLFGFAVKFNLFGSSQDFVHVPFDRVGNLQCLLAVYNVVKLKLWCVQILQGFNNGLICYLPELSFFADLTCLEIGFNRGFL